MPTDEEVALWKRSYVDWMDSPQGFIVDRQWDENTHRWKLGPHHMRLHHILRRIMAEALAMDDGKFRYRTIILSFLKKTGKSALAASVTAWMGWSQGANNEIYIVANDEQQAEQRIYKDVVYSLRHSPWLPAKTGRYETRMAGNGTMIYVLGVHYTSAAGGRQILTVWDELWGYTSEEKQRMYDEMSPVPTADNSIRLVVTYAGFLEKKRGDSVNLLRDEYEKNVGKRPDGTMEFEGGQGQKIPGLEDLPCWRNGSTFICWFHEPFQPWQTDEYYDEERRTLRPAAFLRFHKNEWVTTREQYIDPTWWERNATLPGPMPPNRRIPIVMAADIAYRHDTASAGGVYMHPKTGDIHLAFHRIWKPLPDKDIDIEMTIEAYLIEMFAKYRVVMIRYDPYQFVGSAQRLAKLRIPMQEFIQQGSEMVSATEELYRLFKGGRMKVYEDEEAKSHVTSAVAVDKGHGSKLDKYRSGKIDFAVMLAMASYECVIRGGLETTEDIVIESPFADTSEWPFSFEQVEMERRLPPELRSLPDSAFSSFGFEEDY